MPRIALISVETRTRDDVHVRLIGATIDRIEALVHRIEASIDGGLECANALDAVPLILK